jgi:VanZ family protein
MPRLIGNSWANFSAGIFSLWTFFSKFAHQNDISLHLWSKRRLNILSLSIWVVFIAGLSLVPGSTVPKVSLFEGVDKLVHGFMYALLVVLAYLTFRRLLLAIVGSVVYGLVLECLQAVGSAYFEMGRSFEMADIAANTSGALFAACILYYFFYT